jgi:hypothetical protein
MITKRPTYYEEEVEQGDATVTQHTFADPFIFDDKVGLGWDASEDVGWVWCGG